jgi:hypothetical protein
MVRTRLIIDNFAGGGGASLEANFANEQVRAAA